jgi:hypothetical protein
MNGGPGDPGTAARRWGEGNTEDYISDTEENIVRIACEAILEHIGEGYGAGPARDTLNGFKHRLEREYPELVQVVEGVLRGDAS